MAELWVVHSRTVADEMYRHGKQNECKWSRELHRDCRDALEYTLLSTVVSSRISFNAALLPDGMYAKFDLHSRFAVLSVRSPQSRTSHHRCPRADTAASKIPVHPV
jgi:hypothetical protein